MHGRALGRPDHRPGRRRIVRRRQGRYATWRYELSEIDGATTITESFSHKPTQGAQRLLYKAARRETALVKGMQKTLDRIKAALER